VVTSSGQEHIVRKHRFLITAAAAGSLVLAGCMTPSPYAPRIEGSNTGYTDQALTQNRYRITFTGNSATPRETVESYLLLRAAEVARAAGYESFIFDTRNTSANTAVSATPGFGDPYYGYSGYSGFGRRSGFSFGIGGGGYGGGIGYGGGLGVGSGFGFPYDPNMDIVARTNYQAYAEIVLLSPEQAANETRAIKATEVINRIRPQSGPTQRRAPT